MPVDLPVALVPSDLHNIHRDLRREMETPDSV